MGTARGRVDEQRWCGRLALNPGNAACSGGPGSDDEPELRIDTGSGSGGRPMRHVVLRSRRHNFRGRKAGL